MAEETETTETIETTESQGISESEFRKIVGEEVDSRISKLDLSKLDVLDGLDERLGEIFKKNSVSNKGGTIDQKGLLNEIGSLIDGKIAGLNVGSSSNNGPRKPGPLGRFLGFGNGAS